MSCSEPLKFSPARVAQHDLAARPRSAASVVLVGVVATPRVLHGDRVSRCALGARRRDVNGVSALHDLERDLAAGEAQVGVRRAARRAAGAPRTAPGSRCRCRARGRPRARTRSPTPSPARSARSRRRAGSRRRRSRRGRRPRRRPRGRARRARAAPRRRPAARRRSASRVVAGARELHDAELHRRAQARPPSRSSTS